MNKEFIQCITFPRSGHHMFIKCLAEYFEHNIGYCEFYNHCKTYPCPNFLSNSKKINIQKNHDNQGEPVEIIDKNKYIVQYRNPVKSAISGFHFVESTIKKELSQSDWEVQAEKRIKEWKEFINKWIINNSNENTHFILYENLMRDTSYYLGEAIRFINPNTSVNEDQLSLVIEENNISDKRQVEDFKFYDEKFMNKLESTVSAEMNRLNVPSYKVNY